MTEEAAPSLFAENNVLLFWMNNGQYMIAKIKKNLLNNELHMSRARMLIPQGGQGGQMSFGMVPLGTPFFDEKHSDRLPVFEKNQYLMVRQADKALADAYLSATSGIMAASPGMLRGLGG